MADHESSVGGTGSAKEALPLRPALSAVFRDSEEPLSPRTGPVKVVSIAEPESPNIPSLDDQPKKQHNAGVAKRLVGRSSPRMTFKTPLVSQESSMDILPEAALASEKQADGSGHTHHHLHRHHHQSHHDKLLTQVAEWLQAEKAKKAARKSKKHHSSTAGLDQLVSSQARPRGGSDSSDSSTMSLEKLQKIIEDNMNVGTSEGTSSSTTPRPESRRQSYISHPRRKSSIRNALMRTASSDTEYQDGDVIVPSCDVVLDNSKTLSYGGGGTAASDIDLVAKGKRAEKEAKAWSIFKGEIVRLAHTLRLKGWRRVPLENGDDIQVERLSGALTNAVYVVSPPAELPLSANGTSKKTPPRLLLRIYGPQVEHLIDRETELGILRRLARKKIGPRLLGTFRNGRFEEFFPSTTLTNADIREPETSKQIAKRMRELHDGIELLEQERDDGPFVWRNWDKWVERCEHVITYLDKKIQNGKPNQIISKNDSWMRRGYVCGVEWPVFRKTIENYRTFLLKHYGGEGRLREALVFAHNDTQYGNILRLKPTGESPLLLPANSHKQLVVIDFEYASANTPGLEFANHFTEWCYNYHDPVAPHACNTSFYPNPEEQRRFIRSYVNHRPQFNPKASATPKTTASPGVGSISSFMLDSRTPGGVPGVTDNYREEEEQRVQATEKQVDILMQEARIWRVANSAQWVAWGIVQANLPELDALDAASTSVSASASTPSSTSPTTAAEVSNAPSPVPSASASAPTSTPPAHNAPDKRPEGVVAEALRSGSSIADARVEEKESQTHESAVDGEEEEEDEFDYLTYAQDRAMFFWGDCVAMGLVSVDKLPAELRKGLKVVAY